MGEPSRLISGFLAFGFFLAALQSGGVIGLGWLLLSVGMVAVTVFRVRTSRRPPGGDDSA